MGIINGTSQNYGQQRPQPRRMKPKTIAWLVGSAIALLVVVTLVSKASPSVDRGMTGFVWDNAAGGFTDKQVSYGWNFLAIDPFTSHVVQYPTANMTATYSRVANEGQAGDTSIQFTSQDNQTGNVDITVQWAVNPKKVQEVYNKYGTDINAIENGVIRMYTKSAANAAASSYQILDIHGAKKPQFAADTTKNLEVAFKTQLNDDFVLVSSVQVGQDYLPPQVQQFVDAKIKAETDQQIAQTKLIQAKTDAQQQVVQAQAKAEADKTAADAALYVAQKQAEGNKALAASISDTLVNYDFVQKIDKGVLPSYWGGGSLLNIVPGNASSAPAGK